MLNLFKRKTKIEEVNYREMHENLAKEYAALETVYEKLVDQVLELKQTNEKLDAQNTRFGNTLFDIVHLKVSRPSTATKTMVAIAKDGLGITP